MDEPDKMVLANHGSPLWIGVSIADGGYEGTAFVSSDRDALSRYTNSIIALEEGDIVEISVLGVRGTHDYLEHIPP